MESKIDLKKISYNDDQDYGKRLSNYLKEYKDTIVDVEIKDVDTDDELSDPVIEVYAILGAITFKDREGRKMFLSNFRNSEFYEDIGHEFLSKDGLLYEFGI